MRDKITIAAIGLGIVMFGAGFWLAFGWAGILLAGGAALVVAATVTQ